MVKKIISLLILIGLLSCSVQKKIERSFEGKGRETLIKEFGEPQKIVPLEDGNQLFIYIKETFVRETEIGTGSFTLDKRISPSFIKEETYRFTIDKEGLITKVSYEKREK